LLVGRAVLAIACSVLLLDAIMSETLPFVIREREPF
jgi:hypothetical protein